MDRGFFRKHLSCLLGPNGSVFTDGQTGFNSAFSFAQAGNNVLQFAPGSRLSKRANVCCLAVKLNVGGSGLLVEVKINGSRDFVRPLLLSALPSKIRSAI